MTIRRTLRTRILQDLADGPILSVYNYLMNVGNYDYPYGLSVFHQLERENLIRMIPRSDLRGRPWEVRSTFPIQSGEL